MANLTAIGVYVYKADMSKKAVIATLCGVFLGAAAVSGWNKYDTEIVCDAMTDLDKIIMWSESKSGRRPREILAFVRKDDIRMHPARDIPPTAIVALNTEATLLQDAAILGVMEITNPSHGSAEKNVCKLIFARATPSQWPGFSGVDFVISSTLSRFP